MCDFKALVCTAATAACCLAVSCAKTPQNAVPKPGPCLLFLHCERGPADRVEVSINGQPLAMSPHQQSGSHDLYQLTFVSSRNTHVLVRLLKGDMLLYQPEFQIATAAGDLLDCELSARDPVPPRSWEQPPSHDFPAQAQGIPPKVWCWFGPSNKKTEFIQVQLMDVSLAGDFKDRAAKKGFRIIRDLKQDMIEVAPPKPMTIVELVLDLQTWPDIKNIYFQPKAVY